MEPTSSDHTSIQRELDKASLSTPSAVLQSSDFGLLRLGSLTTSDIDRITANAAETLLKPGYMTALAAEQQLKNHWQRLSTGCALLDSTLGGGVSARGITEVSGTSGCGKTQLCLQLCLSVQYPKSRGGLEAGAVYICTEDSFPTKRLQQLFSTYPSRRSSSLEDRKLPRFGDNIFIEHVADPEGMRQCVLGRLPQLLSKRKIGLIVVDSIAGAFRSAYDSKDFKNRAQDLRTVGGQLHLLAWQHNLCVVCVNQVSGAFSGNSSLSSNHSVPALGLAWANLVTTRMQMNRYELNGADSLPIRSLKVIFAPDLPQDSISYMVHEGGVFGCDG